MKTRELIAKLQEEDPSGDLDVVIGTTRPLDEVEVLPSYYDGAYQKIEGDDKGRPLRASICRTGQKLCLKSTSIDEAVMSYPDLEVLTDNERDKRWIEATRAQAKAIHDHGHQRIFGRWAMDTHQVPWEEAKRFFNQALSAFDPMPDDIRTLRKFDPAYNYDVMPSWNDRRRLQWDREIVFEDGKLRRVSGEREPRPSDFELKLSRFEFGSSICEDVRRTKWKLVNHWEIAPGKIFWMFLLEETHEFVVGDGSTDAEALDDVRYQIAVRTEQVIGLFEEGDLG